MGDFKFQVCVGKWIRWTWDNLMWQRYHQRLLNHVFKKAQTLLAEDMRNWTSVRIITSIDWITRNALNPWVHCDRENCAFLKNTWEPMHFSCKLVSKGKQSRFCSAFSISPASSGNQIADNGKFPFREVNKITNQKATEYHHFTTPSELMNSYM